MEGIGSEVTQKIRSAIKAKLVELGAYVDDELPDYIMVMVANKKTKSQMTEDLSLFLGTNTESFTSWLHGVLEHLQKVTFETKQKLGFVSEEEKSENSHCPEKATETTKTKAKDKNIIKKFPGNPVSNKTVKPKEKKSKSKKPVVCESINKQAETVYDNNQTAALNSTSDISPKEDESLNQKTNKNSHVASSSSGNMESEKEKKNETKLEIGGTSNMDSHCDDNIFTDKQRQKTIKGKDICDTHINTLSNKDVCKETEKPLTTKTSVKYNATSGEGLLDVELDENDEFLALKADPETDDLLAEELQEDSFLQVGSKPAVSYQKKTATVAAVSHTRSCSPKKHNIVTPIQRHDSSNVLQHVQSVTPKHPTLLQDKSNKLRSLKRGTFPSSTVGAVVQNPSRFVEENEEEYDPRNPSVGSVASIIKVSERRSSVPLSMQANKLLILKAVEDANRSVAKNTPKLPARVEPYQPTPIYQLKDKQQEVQQRVPVKPIDTKLVVQQRVPVKPIDTKLVVPQRVPVKPIDTKLVVQQHVPVKPMDTKLVVQQRVPVKPMDTKLVVQQCVPVKPMDTKLVEPLEEKQLLDDYFTLEDQSDEEPVVREAVETGQSSFAEFSNLQLQDYNEQVDEDLPKEKIDQSGDSRKIEFYTTSNSVATVIPLKSQSKLTISGKMPILTTVPSGGSAVTPGTKRKIPIICEDSLEDKQTSPRFVVTLEGIRPDHFAKKSKVRRTVLSGEKSQDYEDDIELVTLEDEITRDILNTDYPMEEILEEEEEEAFDAPQKKLKLRERCKYWPGCKNGEKCSYHHPTVQCKAFPNCKFGEKCLYIHPNCKYDAGCTRKDCPFTHASKRTFSASISPPVYIVSSPKVSTNKAPCRFFPKCKNINCPYFHPKLCKFGNFCRNAQCPFLHSQAPPPQHLKWTAPQCESSHLSERKFALKTSTESMPVQTKTEG
ncbi:zinc finger CCCH domain-containing protein 14-like isoform X2 [Limulus polyphemus]|uniref:Zinc finger CCCH domain-containing protein 14 n=1 Tax=Limulus polyphemus TaxID=6850 RepID=A0ABM1SF23_LIMPO|nr:zinc finger CCCH domain-containing protein 14-like isoform X2 [Limulus polyphemus]